LFERLAQLVGELGIEARVALGHSLGEISALSWAGALSSGAAIELAALRGRVMSHHALEIGRAHV
jgi:enediyne polyketide synthase